MGRCWSSFEAHTRKILDCYEQNVGRNMDAKSHSCKISDKHEEQVTRNYGKGDPCYKLARNLAELRSSVLQEVKLASNKNG